MIKFFEKLNDLMTRAALYERGLEPADDKPGEGMRPMKSGMIKVPQAEPGEFQTAKSSAKGHGEQRVLPDDCEFGDNELCYVEA